MESENADGVMVSLGTFAIRVVHASTKHPQIGWVHFEGEKHKVFIGFWGDCPVWKLMHVGDEEEYAYCASRPMPIEDDPDYCTDVAATVVYQVVSEERTHIHHQVTYRCALIYPLSAALAPHSDCEQEIEMDEVTDVSTPWRPEGARP